MVPTSATGKSELSVDVPLQQLIEANRRLDELGTARVIADAAEAVHKAQTGGKPLGTLSPQTIVVQSTGQAKLVVPGQRSVAYAAPECLRGMSGDRRSDVFSLGVLLWEALAHARLFEGATDDAIRAAVLAGEIRPPSESNANIPPELDAICKKALAPDPVDRYQSAKVMAAEISAVLDDAGYPEDTVGIARYLAHDIALVPRPPVLPVQPAARPGSQTMQGISPIRELEATMRVKASAAPVEASHTLTGTPTDPARAKTPTGDPARAKTPTAPPAQSPRAKSSTEPPRAQSSSSPPPSTLPAWATSRPASSSTPPPEASPMPASDPASTLPGIPQMLTSPSVPVATESPPSNKTAIMGSMSDAELVLPFVVAPGSLTSGPIGRKTEVHGSHSLADRLAALSTPVPGSIAGLPALPPGADPPSAKPTIANAETVATPILTSSEAPSGVQSGAQYGVSPAAETAASAGVAATVTSGEAIPHPAATISLPNRRAGTQPGGKGDMLGGWGWGTGPHEAIALPDADVDSLYHDDIQSQATRKRLVMAIGGAAAVVLLIVIAAFAFGGSSDKQEKVSAKPTDNANTVDWSAPTETAPAVAPPEPAAPASTEPAVVDPATTSADAAAIGEPQPEAVVEPLRPEPAIVEPAKPEPPKPEPAKPEPVKIAKPEPKVTKPEPVKPEPKVTKPEPKVTKVTPKPEPKTSSWDPLKPRGEKQPAQKRTEAKPIDPYAEPRKPAKVDAAAAYRTGLQQFARGDSSAAMSTFRSVLASDPFFAPAHRGLGMVYEKLGKKGQARNSFRRYLQLSPTAGDAEQIRDRMGRL